MEPKVEKSFRLIYEDENLAVVDKPGNLPCHPGGSYCENTLLHLLRNAGIAQPFIINRLDRETSGIVLVAKNGETAKSLAGQFKRHTVEKEYTVLVHGAFPQKLSAKGWLTHDDASVIVKKRKFVETADAPDDKAESAETDFELAATEGMLSRVIARPKTGRTHQIRSTLLSLGYPVVGDKIYGLDETFFLRFITDALTDDDRARLIFPRQALHASALTIVANGEKRTFTSPPPF